MWSSMDEQRNIACVLLAPRCVVASIFVCCPGASSDVYDFVINDNTTVMLLRDLNTIVLNNIMVIQNTDPGSRTPPYLQW